MRAVLPSTSPTTLSIRASASLIGFRLSVENSSTAFLEHRSAPAGVDGDAAEEDREPEPADEGGAGLRPDGRHHRRDDEDRYQPQTQGVRRHTRGSMAIVIDRRYRGPDDSANGGYAAGRFAAAQGGEVVEVTLRLP